MRIVFRADASKEIGSGHVMRSTAIAEEAISRGIPSVFVGRIDDLSWVSNRVKNLGFDEVIGAPSEFIPDSNHDVLVIDSYEISVSDIFLEKTKWNKVVSIFDQLTPNYSCDLRIHPGLTKKWPDEGDCRTLAGPKYVPLRKSIKKSDRSNSESKLEIVVVGGGTDLFNFVPAIAKVLSGISNEFNVRLFVNTSMNLHLGNRFVESTTGLDLDLVAESVDLVFTTASTTSLEFLARGKAIAIGCAIDNQALYYKELRDGNYAAAIGEHANGEWIFNLDIIHELILSKTLRDNLRENAKDLIDLKGAERIVDEISAL